MTRLLLALLLAPTLAQATARCPEPERPVPAIIMRAIELTESGGEANPDIARGDDGQSWGRYQISILWGAECLGERRPGETDDSFRWRVEHGHALQLRVVLAVLHPPRNRDIAERRAAYCLGRLPPGWLSRMYACYRGLAGWWDARQPLTRNERRFAANLKMLEMREGR